MENMFQPKSSKVMIMLQMPTSQQSSSMYVSNGELPNFQIVLEETSFFSFRKKFMWVLIDAFNF